MQGLHESRPPIAMILAAGRGSRLWPFTEGMPKSLMPILDQPVMGHVHDLLRRHGITEVVANAHYFPNQLRAFCGRKGIRLREEQRLLGTAGGVRNFADAFRGRTIVVASGDALTDFDVTTFLAEHRRMGGVMTVAVKRVPDARRFGVVEVDERGVVTGFRETPAGPEPVAGLVSCGIYAIDGRRIFDWIPNVPTPDWALDVFPHMREQGVPLRALEIGGYWNDIGSVAAYRQATFDVLEGRVDIRVPGVETAPGSRIWLPDPSRPLRPRCKGPVWVSPGTWIATDVELRRCVVGARASISDGCLLANTIVLPGTVVQPRTVLDGAVFGTMRRSDQSGL